MNLSVLWDNSKVLLWMLLYATLLFDGSRLTLIEMFSLVLLYDIHVEHKHRKSLMEVILVGFCLTVEGPVIFREEFSSVHTSCE